MAMTPGSKPTVPAVTVVVPNYNHARFLPQRLDSIFAQSFADLEVVILDDASSDDSLAVLHPYLTRPNVRFQRNAVNSGSAFKQWEQGLALARGRYVWFAESDDWADPDFLAALVPVLDAHPALGLTYCQSWMADEDGRVTGDAAGWTEALAPGRWGQDFTNSGRDEIRRFLLDRNTIPNASAVLVRREVLAATGPLPATLKLCGDWLVWMRVLGRSDLAYCARPLNYWRQNTSHSRAAAPGTLEWLEGESVLKEGAALAGLTAQETEAVLMKFLRKCWQWQREALERTGAESLPRPGWRRRLSRLWTR